MSPSISRVTSSDLRKFANLTLMKGFFLGAVYVGHEKNIPAKRDTFHPS